MEIHNTTKNIVESIVHTVFEEINKSGNPEKLCLCYQCRLDTICFTLNRSKPHYIVSNRGLSQIAQRNVDQRQVEVDITSLVYRGIRLVNHNLRPTAPHDASYDDSSPKITTIDSNVFEVPTISGRIFNGESFELAVNLEVELYCEGQLVPMKNDNWQNPFIITQSTPGLFNFWPASISADHAEVEQVFKYSLKVKSADYEPTQHFFSISLISKPNAPSSHSLNRFFKLPDIYVFPPKNETVEEGY